MRSTRLSPFGFLMNALNLPTVTLARALHVDASLVSKWKSGDRSLTRRSAYFDDIVRFLLSLGQESPQSLHDALSLALPAETIPTEGDLTPYLRRALDNASPQAGENAPLPFRDSQARVSALIFEGTEGIRNAVVKLLATAESMPQAGVLTFIDTNEYRWLTSDREYTLHFTDRIISLLAKGAKARFVIHYSASRERSVELFKSISPLVFHRNVEWYYYEYYDDSLFHSSLFLLNRTISLLSMAADDLPPTMMAFTDPALILRHEELSERIIRKCRPVFETFPTDSFLTVIENIYSARRRGALYSFLPAPAFLFAEENLLSRILEDNGIGPDARETCLDLNRKCSLITSNYFSPHQKNAEPFILLFQLEEMERRASIQPFISASLSLIEHTTVTIRPEHFAAELRQLAADLRRYDNFHILLVSKDDHIPLPAINCWCKQYTWMIQMDDAGFRLSDEAGIVSAASITFERCIRHIPPSRKDKEAVCRYLLRLAEEITPLIA